jgi:serine/threonine protein kinase
MELKGDCVYSYLRKNVEDSIHTKLDFALKMLTSIENTHAAGIVHRDIKPTNFVRGMPTEPDSDDLYLIDFGLAKQHLDARGEVLPSRS